MKDKNIHIKVACENKKQKYTNQEIRFVYNNLKRFFIGIAFFMVVILGLFLVIIQKWFTVLFGLLLISIGLLSILNLLFFKALIFYDDCLIKEWFVFGRKKIKFKNLKTAASKRVWTGTIIFRDKRKNSFSQFFMDFETFPIANDGFREIRKILIDKKVIEGNENGWNY